MAAFESGLNHVSRSEAGASESAAPDTIATIPPSKLNYTFFPNIAFDRRLLTRLGN